MHLEHRSKLWNTAELGSLLVRRLRADSTKQQCRHPRNQAIEPPPATRRAQQRRDPVPRLNAAMACDTAFRVVARRYLADLTANHDATCRGDPVALHRMRIALTHLRTAILFFSPMVADATRTRIRAELKWLNAHLGVMRDLDVAIERLKAIDKRRPQAIPHYRAWTAKRADSPPRSGARAPISQISASGQEHIRLDRAWTMVDQEGKAGRAEARFSGRGL